MLYLLVAYCGLSTSVTIVELESPSVVEILKDEDSADFTIDIVRTIHWNYLEELLSKYEYNSYYRIHNQEFIMNYIRLRNNFGYINQKKYFNFTESIGKKLGNYYGEYMDKEIRSKISKIADYSDINEISNVKRLSWILNICEDDDKFKVDAYTRIMAFRLYFEVASFDCDKFLEVFGKLRVLFYMEAKGKIKEGISRIESRKRFYNGLRDNLFSILDLVREEEWEDLYKIIDPSLETFEKILDFVDKRDSNLVDFFRDMIVILRGYKRYFSKNDVMELFDILRRLLNGKLSHEDYELICRMYYICYFIEDFKNHFLDTPGEVVKEVDFNKLERNLRSMINDKI